MYRHAVTVGGKDFALTAFTPGDASEFGLTNWSLQPLQTYVDALRNGQLAAGFRNAFKKAGSRCIFAPRVKDFSANVVREFHLNHHIYLRNVVLHRNHCLPADCVQLEKPDHSFAMSGRGCPVIIAVGGEVVFVGHAGRNSLVDPGAVLDNPTRKYVSIVHTIFEAFVREGISPAEVSMRMFFAIPASVFRHPFGHPVYGNYNRKLAEFIGYRWPGSGKRSNGCLELDLEQLFLAQAAKRGVKDVRAEFSLDTHDELTHTRDGRDPSARNLIVVKRCS